MGGLGAKLRARPALVMRAGGRAGGRASHQQGQLVGDDLHNLLAGVELADDVGAQAAVLDIGGEALDDLEVDVRLEQCQSDLAHRLLDVALGQSAPLTHIAQRRLQLLGQRVEHQRRNSRAWNLSTARDQTPGEIRHACLHRDTSTALGSPCEGGCCLDRAIASPIPPNASANSDGITNTLLESPSASEGSICRYS